VARQNIASVALTKPWVDMSREEQDAFIDGVYEQMAGALRQKEVKNDDR